MATNTVLLQSTLVARSACCIGHSDEREDSRKWDAELHYCVIQCFLEQK